MKIRCVHNLGKHLPSELTSKEFQHYESLRFDLKIGKEYLVYAMTSYHGYMWYYILDEQNLLYPICYPAPLFEVVDFRFSRYWIYTYEGDIVYSELPHPVWAIPEWAHNPDIYYGKLSAEALEETEIFYKYKELMELEFYDKKISRTALIGNTTQLICSSCKFQWFYPSSHDAMVKCPKCQKIMHNPRYENCVS